MFQCHETCWPASDDSDLQDHLGCDQLVDTLKVLKLAINTNADNSCLDLLQKSVLYTGSLSEVRMITAGVSDTGRCVGFQLNDGNGWSI